MRRGYAALVADDKALDAARARVRLLEQTISELRRELAARPPAGRAPAPSEGGGDGRGRRNSMRPPSGRGESSPSITALQSALEALQRDLDERTRERDEARASVTRRDAEVQTLRSERDAALAGARKRDGDFAAARSERDEAMSRCRAMELEREGARARIGVLEAQIESERAAAAAAAAAAARTPAKPVRRHTAELESQTLRVQALERQLEALRAAWKTAEDRAVGLEAKLKQVRSVDTVAVLRVAADRAGELARLLEGAATKLAPET